MAGLRIRGSSWIFGVGGCNVARRNEKTALPGGRFGCFSAPGGDWNEQPQPAISLPMTGYHLNPYHTPMLPPWCLWHVCMDWNHELLPCWRGSRAERGDSAHGPNAQRHRSTDTHTGRHEKTGQKAPESHQEAFKSGRCGVGWWCSFRACRGAEGGWKRHPSPIV